jgi:hypothetical protein
MEPHLSSSAIAAIRDVSGRSVCVLRISLESGVGAGVRSGVESGAGVGAAVSLTKLLIFDKQLCHQPL